MRDLQKLEEWQDLPQEQGEIIMNFLSDLDCGNFDNIKTMESVRNEVAECVAAAIEMKFMYKESLIASLKSMTRNRRKHGREPEPVSADQDVPESVINHLTTDNLERLLTLLEQNSVNTRKKISKV